MTDATRQLTQHAGLTLPSLFAYFSMISPFLLVLVFVFISIINSNLKGLIYLLGIILLFFIIAMFQNVLRVPLPNKASAYCQLFAVPFPIFTVPSFNSAIFLFTIVYLFVPMMINHIMNFPLLFVILVLFVVDCSMKSSHFCTSPTGIILGAFIGIVWGLFWYFLIQSQNNELLYYDDLLSNKVACSRPTQQKFKCSVYKNGELLQTL
jgi:hypothetical protein